MILKGKIVNNKKHCDHRRTVNPAKKRIPTYKSDSNSTAHIDSLSSHIRWAPIFNFLSIPPNLHIMTTNDEHAESRLTDYNLM